MYYLCIAKLNKDYFVLIVCIGAIIINCIGFSPFRSVISRLIGMWSSWPGRLTGKSGGLTARLRLFFNYSKKKRRIQIKQFLT